MMRNSSTNSKLLLVVNIVRYFLIELPNQLSEGFLLLIADMEYKDFRMKRINRPS